MFCSNTRSLDLDAGKDLHAYGKIFAVEFACGILSEDSTLNDTRASPYKNEKRVKRIQKVHTKNVYNSF